MMCQCCWHFFLSCHWVVKQQRKNYDVGKIHPVFKSKIICLNHAESVCSPIHPLAHDCCPVSQALVFNVHVKLPIVPRVFNSLVWHSEIYQGFFLVLGSPQYFSWHFKLDDIEDCGLNWCVFQPQCWDPPRLHWCWDPDTPGSLRHRVDAPGRRGGQRRLLRHGRAADASQVFAYGGGEKMSKVSKHVWISHFFQVNLATTFICPDPDEQDVASELIPNDLFKKIEQQDLTAMK